MDEDASAADVIAGICDADNATFTRACYGGAARDFVTIEAVLRAYEDDNDK